MENKPKKKVETKNAKVANRTKGAGNRTTNDGLLTCNFPGCYDLFSSEQEKQFHWECTHEDENNPFLWQQMLDRYALARAEMTECCPDASKLEYIKTLHRSSTVREYFHGKGLLGQSRIASGGLRTIPYMPPKPVIRDGEPETRHRYGPEGYKLPKPYAWWIIFLTSRKRPISRQVHPGQHHQMSVIPPMSLDLMSST